jgi:hypothetical protein
MVVVKGIAAAALAALWLTGVMALVVVMRDSLKNK